LGVSVTRSRRDAEDCAGLDTAEAQDGMRNPRAWPRA